MRTYTLTIPCDCGGDMECRIGDLTADPDGEVRIDVSLALSQTTFGCPSCGDKCHTGDLEDICFGEEDQ